MHRLGAVMLSLTLAVAMAMPSKTGTSELTEENFDRLMKHIRPTEKESRWQEIPWRNTFWDAVQEANRAEKPILLWGMNGHPLGCT